MVSADAVWRDLRAIRAEAPLVHNITNYVVMNTTANALLAVGASPVMAHAIDEVEEMVGLARALVLNIGTLDAAWIQSMIRAGHEARSRGLPIVLDPVGSGATRLRTATARRLMAEAPPTVVRGNASEIRSLVTADRSTRGVDSTYEAEAAIDAARELATSIGCVVSVSGATDVIVSTDGLVRCGNGHPLMARVTGMGCIASALTGACVAVNRHPLWAAAHAMAIAGIAGELAAERAPVLAPGSFQPAFLDALFLMEESDIASRLRLDEA